MLDNILHVVAYDSDELHLVSASALAGLSAPSNTAPLVDIEAPMVWARWLSTRSVYLGSVLPPMNTQKSCIVVCTLPRAFC